METSNAGAGAPPMEREARGAGGVVVRRLRRDLPFFLIATAVLGFDQLTKAIIRANLALGESWPNDDWLVKLTHITNSGAAFGILQGQVLFLTITALVGSAAILIYYLFPPLEHGIFRVALGLQLGGALGNLLDRLRFGEVTDFIDFPRYPAFNVADSSIVIGLCLIVGYLVLVEFFGRGQPNETDSGGGDS